MGPRLESPFPTNQAATAAASRSSARAVFHKSTPRTLLMADSSQVSVPFMVEDLNLNMPQPELPAPAPAPAPTPDPIQSEPGHQAPARTPDPVQSEPGHQAPARTPEPVAEPGHQAPALTAEPGHQAPALALSLAPVAAPDSSSPASNPQQIKHKNRLQEYTQRACLPLPIYQTVNLGSQHEPKFWSTVLVDGATYSSSNTFSHRKAAEQDAARLALEFIPEKIKFEGPPIICEDTTFCKSILNEYAVKMNLDMPAYNTVQPHGSLPSFVSSLVFNGVSYTGNTGKNKKEAEQLAARAVILSLLGDNRTGTILYEIIKSKDKLYAAFHKGKNFQTHHNSTLHGGSTGPDYGMPVTQDREVEAFVIPGASLEANQPHYETMKRKPEPPFEPNPLPITIVPPFSAQTLGDGPSHAKKRRKNKKKANKKIQNGDELSLSSFPLSQAPHCSVAQ
ncbi:double-stranded RNA-binding protein 4 isoform X3 [Tripterygium wilfordii]|uniref:Double-stranded RNA-binding protein 4 isoform X3 n=1 Tax=Tripterygium wilfordii TaxID=458696 RepID=A0A7J7D655_TRIWF|nr:double-stranded RNA-binding protein 4-like [Tripterygium wilfordii]KAF5741802.1 double-stranded RNA-binding protein 4 isoform X3 [Tripterygium wilfordii]